MSRLSVVIPLLNEEETLPALHERLKAALPAVTADYEIIYVDDGSTDCSPEILRGLYEQDRQHVRVIEFRRNFGKTAALSAGFNQARGEIIATLDADLQDDPAELPRLIAELENGYDMVVGWRKERQDSAGKLRSSLFFNRVVSRLTGNPFNDLNSGFKVYRREVIKTIRLYSDLHRYIPILATWYGFRVAECPVTHHPRRGGESKYGYGRIARGIIDLLMVLFLTRYLRHPLRLFGWLGLATLSGGLLINLYLAGLWFLRFFSMADVAPIGTRPLLAVVVLGMLLGIQFISIGLIGEMIRYFHFRPSDEYSIRHLWN